MAMQRTTEGRTSGSHAMTREQALPFAIRALKDTFDAYPPAAQARIKAEVIERLRAEQRSREFAAQTSAGRRAGSALWQLAEPVYGITAKDLY
jgi:hypothetical protein